MMMERVEWKDVEEIKKEKSIERMNLEVLEKKDVYLIVLKNRKKKDGFEVIKVDKGKSVFDVIVDEKIDEDKVLGIFIEEISTFIGEDDTGDEEVEIREKLILNKKFKEWFEKKYKKNGIEEFEKILLDKMLEF